MTELTRLTIADARRMLDSREITATELAEAHISRAEQVEPTIRAFITPMFEQARAMAANADAAIARGESQPLTGIPIGLKDILCTTDAPTTAASKMLDGYRPPFDATVVERMRAQGAVFVGKLNTDEFAMGSSTESSAFFTTHNPWDPERVPGGSSGGSAASVAAGEAMAALGSDTGGSIRQPAGFCGVVGLKPTYGRVSRWGLMAFASSLDQIGPFTRTTEDAAIVLGAIAGHDSRDSTSAQIEVPDYRASLTGDIRGMKIGIAREFSDVDGMDPGVAAACEAAYAEFERLGAKLVPVSLPFSKYALPTYYITAPAEASANLARLDGIKYGFSVDGGSVIDSYLRTRGEGFGPEVKRRIMLGTYALASGYYDAYYVKAQKVRTLIKRDYDRAFEDVDVILAPTSPTVAFRIGERADDPIQMYLSDIFTIPANMAGLPGIAIPCGFSDGMPVSLQVLGRAFGEPETLRVAYAYEQATQWPTMPDSIAPVTGDPR
ncbi:MAG TPA: Asp-tRNA(Asn)/Glu-tRNA(Gln) amidotransferase subunit GatA [Thermomicrobiales bacterium]|mgnify:FL=1|nr:Asp-tRNA(Asn)/Glu-tRNA(Gln) amidotransferase GatCAB subunit A [Chloroflexota bacterium]HQX62985.1 Asp-tRNA(Asn)/Glu-tRNA(Gln) amidotransferase subunit GatA [Thermomicrobiales bacterium]